MHPKRHPIRLEYRAGCDADGRLTALWGRMVGDCGSYASVGMKVLERAAGHASGPVPRARRSTSRPSRCAPTTRPCGAFRGFGANQAQFAMEGVLDRLAAQVGISGWEIGDPQRDRARARCGVRARSWTTAASGRRACLDAIASRRTTSRGGRGQGGRARARPQELGPGQRVQGGRQGGRALPRRRHGRGAPLLDRDGPGRAHRRPAGRGRRARCRPGRSPGPGRHHPRARRRPDHREPRHADGRRVGGRCVPCRPGRRLPHRASTTRASSGSTGPTRSATALEQPVIHSAFGYAAQLVVVEPRHRGGRAGVAVHDVGRAVNPLLCEGQIEGAVHMGLGYACTEDFPADEPACRPT